MQSYAALPFLSRSPRPNPRSSTPHARRACLEVLRLLKSQWEHALHALRRPQRVRYCARLSQPHQRLPHCGRGCRHLAALRHWLAQRRLARAPRRRCSPGRQCAGTLSHWCPRQVQRLHPRPCRRRPGRCQVPVHRGPRTRLPRRPSAACPAGTALHTAAHRQFVSEQGGFQKSADLPG